MLVNQSLWNFFIEFPPNHYVRILKDYYDIIGDTHINSTHKFMTFEKDTNTQAGPLTNARQRIIVEAMLPASSTCQYFLELTFERIKEFMMKFIRCTYQAWMVWMTAL